MPENLQGETKILGHAVAELPVIPAKPPEIMLGSGYTLETKEEILGNVDDGSFFGDLPGQSPPRRACGDRGKRCNKTHVLVWHGMSAYDAIKIRGKERYSRNPAQPTAIDALKILRSREVRAYDKKLNKFLKIPFPPRLMLDC